MSLQQQYLRDTVKLLRIPFSVFLMPVFLLAVSQVQALDPGHAIWAFVLIHLLVYPSSNGYNSYIDRDETPIGGLERPPLPPRQLYVTTLVMDLLAVLLGYVLVKPLFAACVLVYIAASRAYSSRTIRLKKYTWAGFTTVFVVQGAFTYYCAYIAASAVPFVFDTAQVLMLLGVSLQIGGAYPLTQIYQHDADLRDGVVTLSYRLGYLGTFAFTAVLFGASMLCYYGYFARTAQMGSFWLLLGFMTPALGFFGYWLLQVRRDVKAASFQNTMRMNLVSSLSLSLCFTLLILQNHAL
ncbi:MAG: hypothetical protein OHK0039_07110 [Bacteroidia bacterium]